jgi:membrane protein required for colicin V production
VDIIARENLFDLLVLLLLVAAFVVGYLQGTVRRLLGIASVVVSLIIAAQLSIPVGDYLAQNWGQFPPGYSRMIAFAVLFGISVVVFAIITELYYERGPFMPRRPLVDPVLGGFLGLLEGMLLIGVLVLVLDSYYLTPNLIVSAGEFVFVRDFFNAMDVSRTADLYRATLIPAFFALFGFFIPEHLRQLYPR